jgi:hypothetical protein
MLVLKTSDTDDDGDEGDNDDDNDDNDDDNGEDDYKQVSIPMTMMTTGKETKLGKVVKLRLIIDIMPK